MSSNKIPLFWYSLDKLEQRSNKVSLGEISNRIKGRRENYGDLLSKYLFEKISGQKTIWIDPKNLDPQNDQKVFFGIGSILKNVSENCIVWGSGIISGKHPVKPADFKAVRGPRTRERLLELDIKCPEIYGDPALLLPDYYQPYVSKKYEYGIIPHYSNYTEAKKIFANIPFVKVIQLLTRDVEKTTDEILGCKKVLTSSLHGLIVAHAYNIPGVLIEFSGNLFGDGVKFSDYLLSVGLKEYNAFELPGLITEEWLYKVFEVVQNLPEQSKINKVKTELLESFPLPIKNNRIGNF